MPGVVFDLGFGQRIIEPAPVVVLRVSAIPENVRQFRVLCLIGSLAGLENILGLLLRLRLERLKGDSVEWDMPLEYTQFMDYQRTVLWLLR